MLFSRVLVLAVLVEPTRFTAEQEILKVKETSSWPVAHASEHALHDVSVAGLGSVDEAFGVVKSGVPLVCGRNQGFGTTGSRQRRASGDCSTSTSSRKETLQESACWSCRACGWPFCRLVLGKCAALHRRLW